MALSSGYGTQHPSKRLLASVQAERNRLTHPKPATALPPAGQRLVNRSGLRSA
jgi:hypothetical protein